ncbi:hypothetical protein K449DRAFT_421061 [Hypoxylon sp. EC38]|nr:hypothetical protein K449DRAFT_421061 [Hypoxylon sp. EC38]
MAFRGFFSLESEFLNTPPTAMVTINIRADLGSLRRNFNCGWRHCVVAEIDGVLRPLAIGEHNVRRRYTWSSWAHEQLLGTMRGECDRQAIISSSNVMTVLSDPANRLAIESELAMAVNYYRETYNTPLPPPDYSRGGATDVERRRFPFIETCLALGTTIQIDHTIHFTLVPPEIIYHENSLYGMGMVLFDITDLDNLRYSFVKDPSYDEPYINKDKRPAYLKIEKPYILSVGQFKENCSFDDELIEETQKLDRFSIIDRHEIDFIWPFKEVPPCSDTRSNSLCHQTIRTLIKSTLDIESFDMSIFELPRLVPNFKKLLQECLLEYSGFLNHTQSAGQIIGLAFEGATHLNLVRYGKLPPNAIRFALQTEELSSVKSISIFSDANYDSIIEIIDELSQVPSLRELCLLQSPMREDDKKSLNFMRKVLSERPQFFKRVKVKLSSVFSTALNKTHWLNPEKTRNCEPPVEIFPVQQMLVFTKGDKHDPHYTYLGNVLLSAEAFAARFLRWLSLASRNALPFCVGPSSLEDLSSLEVNPVVGDCDAMDLKPWSWTVLVKRGHGLKYAFVRPRDEVVGVDDLAVKHITRPDQLEVTGLKGFLKATTSSVDLALLDRLMVETVQTMADREGSPQAAPGLEWISVLEHNEVKDLLDFSLSAQSIRNPYFCLSESDSTSQSTSRSTSRSTTPSTTRSTD